MKSHRPHSSRDRRRSIVRSPLVLALLFMLPLWSYCKLRSQVSVPPDAPSGFLPGLINYFAGNGTTQGSYSDGSVPTQVPIPQPYAVASDSVGNIYVTTSSAIYMAYAGGAVPATLANVTTHATPAVTPQAGRIYQIAGQVGICGDIPDATCGEGLPLNLAAFGDIVGLVFDSANNLYLADFNSNVVRKVNAQTSIVTTIAGQLNIASSSTDLGDGGPATAATLNGPAAIAVDSFANIYIADSINDVVRVVYSQAASAPPPILSAEGISVGPSQAGFIYTVAGEIQEACTNAPTPGAPGAPGGCGDYGPAASSNGSISYLESVAVDHGGNLYLSDTPYVVTVGGYIRVVYAGATVPSLLNLALNPGGGSSVAPTNGYIYAVTGYSLGTPFTSCTLTPCGDGGLAGNMQMGNTTLLFTLDQLGNVYIADAADFAIRKIDTSGYASTVAGIDDPNQMPPVIPAAPGGVATSTQISNSLNQVSFDPQDNLYIADGGLNLVWQAAPLLPQTIDFPAFDPATVDYGVSPITLAATATSNLPVQYEVASTPAGVAHLSGSQLVITGAGSVSVTGSQPGNSQYNAAPPVSQTLTVDPAPLTVTVNNASKIVGSPNPAFSAMLTGFVNGDKQMTPGVYAGAPAFSTTATTDSPTGQYPITASIGTLSSTNYAFTTFVPGTLVVTGSSPQTISFAPLAPVTYGQASTLTLTATASSKLAVSFQVISGPGKIPANGSTLTITGGGTIVITATQEGGGIYAAATPVTQSLVVKPAPLTVTGPTVTTTYGIAINPSTFPTATIAGFVSPDTQSSVLTGSAQYTTATGTPNAGTYPITVGVGTLTLLPSAAASYVVAPPVNGSLIVRPAAQTISLNPVPSAQTYGTPVTLSAVSSSGLPISFTATGSSSFPFGSTTNPPGVTTVTLNLTGVSTVVVTATQTGTTNYLPARPVTQTFNVSPAPLNITANNVALEQGAPLPVTFGYTVGTSAPGVPGGFVNGDSDTPSVITGIPVLTTAATPSSPPGTYAIVPSQGTLAAPNYYFVYNRGQLLITPSGTFSITASPTSLTIASGLSAQATLTMTPSNLYQGTVTLTCGQVPANVNCLVSPSTFVFPGNQASNGAAPYENAAQGTITISASGSTVVGSVRGNGSMSRAATAGLLAPGAIAGLLIAFSRRRAATRRGIWGAVVLVALAAGMLGISSCGSSPNSLNAAPGTSTVMITGSGTTISGNGTVSASVPLSVTIQ